ncbi:MAG TPA: acetyl-CoA carboxylase biotin carboxyl carrier protein [candidate division Zixibacteria bacterium]|nr:acetyl-CoA carboxylase biotin carboxyl carrier protein [candidate division Zixibacteria bacterium]
MDIEKIKELLKLLEESEIDELELEIEDESGEIKLRKGRPEGATTIYNNIAPSPMGGPVPQGAQSPPTAQVSASAEEKEADEFAGMVEITSPIVGTFYSAPAPDAEPYTKVGEHIEEGEVVCIVEAMKLMNEIQSEVSGKVVKILVENAQPVEFGQVMFIIDPD